MIAAGTEGDAGFGGRSIIANPGRTEFVEAAETGPDLIQLPLRIEDEMESVSSRGPVVMPMLVEESRRLALARGINGFTNVDC